MSRVENDIQILELKSMEPQILEQLSDLLIRVVDDGASIGFLSPLRIDESIQYWQEAIQAGIHVWIAIRDEIIIGTMQLHLVMKQNALHRAEICKLMVHPLHRMKGIARILMNTAEDKAKSDGRNLLVLDTRAGDPSNILYKSLGYIEVGRVPKYALSSNGVLDDTIIYYKEI
jgi:ribosomal protein S18 acetylase RimI-like enzyme